MSALDGIRQRVEAYRDHGTPGLHAPKDRAALLAALDAVIKVHEPIDAAMNPGSRHERIVQVCTGCGTDDGDWQRWPCPTMRAIESSAGAA